MPRAAPSAAYDQAPSGNQGSNPPAQTPAPESAPSPVEATTAECFPACRSGFLCHLGQCVSACNPPCPGGSSCTPAGECVAGVPPQTVAVPALVPEPPFEQERPIPPEHVIVLDTSIHSTGNSRIGFFDKLLVVATDLRGHFEVGRRVTLEAELPFVFARGNGLSIVGLSDFRSSTTRVGNPVAEVLYSRRTTQTRLELGGGLALPLASIPDVSPASELTTGQAVALMAVDAYNGALALRGLWDSWAFAPETLTLLAPVRWRHRKDGFEAGVEGAFALLISTSQDTQDDTTTILQVGGHAGYASDTLLVAARLRHVLLLDEDADDQHQASLEPFVEVRSGSVIAGGGVLINLDEPLGVLGSDGADIWSARLSAGGSF